MVLQKYFTQRCTFPAWGSHAALFFLAKEPTYRRLDALLLRGFVEGIWGALTRETGQSLGWTPSPQVFALSPFSTHAPADLPRGGAPSSRDPACSAKAWVILSRRAERGVGGGVSPGIAGPSPRGTPASSLGTWFWGQREMQD